MALSRGGPLTVLLLLLSTSCAPQPGPLRPVAARPLLLAVVTWNMGAGGGDLTRLLADLSSGRLTGVAAPDFVLLLQEATEPGIRQAAPMRGAPLSTFFAPVRKGPLRTTGNAIVASLPLSDARVIDLPRERQLRAAAGATVVVGGERLFVVSAHLENRLGWLRGLFGDRARRRQAEALVSALPAIGHGIVGGDMNTMLGPSEPALRTLLHRFADTPGDPPRPTFRDRLVLDHLFFDVPDRWTVSRHVLGDAYGSDHHPVLGLIASAR